jgi:amino acid transporter
LRTEAAAKERLSIPVGLAILSSDVLSSAAYATDELLAVLVIGGAAALQYALPISIAIVTLLGVLVISYRQLIRAYPNGGGAYTVAKENLGQSSGLVAASGLLIDYVLTVSVSVAAGIDAMTSAFPSLGAARVEMGLVILLVLMIGNLRGVKEAGRLFSLPTFFFVGSMVVLLVVGMVKYALGQTVGLTQTIPTGVIGNLSLFLLLRGFSSGCTALTGTEAISNGVRVFKSPEADNARKTMVIMGVILGGLFLGITFLAKVYGVLPTGNQTVISQIAHLILGNGVMYYVIQFATLLILILAANTSFSDFPRVAFMLGRDKYLPQQLSDVGSRLVYSKGMILLAFLSGLIFVVFEGNVANLIPLYCVGVFISFTLAQAGMVKHWYRLKGINWVRSAVLNGMGAIFTAVALIIIVATKFTQGAWFVVLLVPFSLYLFSRIHKHYQYVAQGLSLQGLSYVSPSAGAAQKHIVVIPVSGVHQAVIKALDYARTISRDVYPVYVACDGAEPEAEIRKKWQETIPDVQLVVLSSPEREVVAPILKYMEKIKAAGNNLVTVVIPEFSSGGWWGRLLHHQTASALKKVFSYQCHIPVVSLVYQLDQEDRNKPANGQMRRPDMDSDLAWAVPVGADNRDSGFGRHPRIVQPYPPPDLR